MKRKALRALIPIGVATGVGLLADRAGIPPVGSTLLGDVAGASVSFFVRMICVKWIIMPIFFMRERMDTYIVGQVNLIVVVSKTYIGVGSEELEKATAQMRACQCYFG